MLYLTANYHALAHLRLQCDTSMDAFDLSVAPFGKAVREFQTKVCAYVDTRELSKETQARKRRKTSTNTEPVTFTAKSKVLNMNTYKFHRMGDYPRAVRMFGPLDGFSTETVSVVIVKKGTWPT